MASGEFDWIEGTPVYKLILLSVEGKSFTALRLFLKVGKENYLLELSSDDSASRAMIDKALEEERPIAVLSELTGLTLGSWCAREPCWECPRNTPHGPTSSEWGVLKVSRTRPGEYGFGTYGNTLFG